MNNINLIIDFDSTFIKLETLDAIANISLNNTADKNNTIREITSITSSAMNGDIPFDDALSKRISLLNASKNDIAKVISLVKNSISNSIIKNKRFFINNNESCYIVSGGFIEIILPIVKSFGFKEENIFANQLIIKNNKITGVDTKNPLSKDKGKVYVLNKYINQNNKTSIILGDGYTDYELKKYNEAKYFIQFIENINRKSLNKHADIIADNFNEVINFIKLLNE